MKNNKFVAGRYKKHFFEKEYEYHSFSPSFLNKPFELEDNKIALLLEEASRLLGELNAYSLLVPDVDSFIQIYIIKEATLSSRIEGTKIEIEEVVLPKEEIIPASMDGWEEVENYVKAVNYGVAKLEKLPLCIRLVSDVHKVLLSGVKGKKKQPGIIRESQNWIGGSNISDAFFVPPYYEELPELLTDLEKFWHNKSLNIPNLIRISLTHYQFETIYPFLDGNGRMGRLLISLQLIYYGFFKKPALYISHFFEKNRASYYDSLNMVREDNDIEQWIKFFLSGVIATSNEGISTFKEIIKLKDQYEKNILGIGRQAPLAHKLLLFLFSKPVVKVKDVEKQLKIAYNTGDSLLNKFCKVGILKEITGQSRNRLFMLWEYLDLFRK
ncbi:Fic family protein [bacterium]|nr:Fic family protein [bacterium]